MSFYKLFNKVYKKIVCMVLVGTIIFSDVVPSFAIALSSLSNGSPLTSESSNRGIKTMDHIAMSLYLSSCIYPGMDNYATAFDKNSEYGSKGKAAPKLNIRNDESGSLKQYVNALISAQTNVSSDANILKIYKGETSVKLRDLIEPHPIMKSQIKANPSFDYKITVKKTTTTNTNSSEGVTVFNGSKTICKAAIDIACAIGRKGGAATFANTINKYADKPLFLDCFGNICVDTGENSNTLLNAIIIIPNYLNPYVIDASGDYLNLLGSLVFDEIPSSIRIGKSGDSNVWAGLGDKVRFTMSWQNWLAVSTTYDIDPKNVIHTYYSTQDNSSVPKDFLTGVGGIFRVVFKEQNDSGAYTTTEGIKDQYNYCVLLNFLLMASTLRSIEGDTDLESFRSFNYSIGKGEIHLNEDLFNITDSVKSLLEKEAPTTMTPEEKKEYALDTAISWMRDPAGVWVWISGIFASMFNLGYQFFSGADAKGSKVDSGMLGFAKIDDYPLLGGFYDFIFHNITWIAVLIFIICLVGNIAFAKDKPLNTLKKVIIIIGIIFVMPKMFNGLSMGFDKLISIICAENEKDWVLAFNIKWDKQTRINRNSQAQQMLAESVYFSESGLNYIQEKSPVIVNNTSDEIYGVLSQSGLGNLFLGTILKQYVNGSEVSSDIGDLNKRLIMLSPLYDTNDLSASSMGSNYFETTFANRVAYSNYLATTSARTTIFKNYQEPLNRSARSTRINNTYFGQGSGEGSLASIPLIHYVSEMDDDSSRVDRIVKKWHAYNKNTTDEGSDVILQLHNNFYFLGNKETNTENIKAIYNTYFANNSTVPTYTRDNVTLNITKIPKFNYYSSNFKDESSISQVETEAEKTNYYDGMYSYFINTENIIPYFYSVWWDLLATSNVRDIGYLVQGEVEVEGVSKTTLERDTTLNADVPEHFNYVYVKDDNGKDILSRNSLLMKKSRIIDYLDLEELFTNVVPYCNHVSEVGRAAFDNLPNEEKYIGDDWGLYKNNKKSWLFDCNWAVKLYEIYKDQLYDSNGKFIQSVGGRPRGWSELDLKDISELTLFEGQILEFYNKLTPHVEKLMTRVNDSSISKGAIIRYLAVVSALEFNKTFSSIGTKLYPQFLDVGSITIDTLWNDLLEVNNYDVSVVENAMINLGRNGHGLIYGLLLLIATLLIRVLFFLKWAILTTFCIGAIVTLLLNTIFSNQREDMVYCGIGIFACFLKIILIYSIPTILLLIFGNVKFFSANGAGVPVWGYIIIIGLLALFCIRLGIEACAQHLGFVRVNGGPMQWGGINSLMTLGGDRTMDNLKNAGLGALGLAKKLPGTAGKLASKAAGAASKFAEDRRLAEMHRAWEKGDDAFKEYERKAEKRRKSKLAWAERAERVKSFAKDAKSKVKDVSSAAVKGLDILYNGKSFEDVNGKHYTSGTAANINSGQQTVQTVKQARDNINQSMTEAINKAATAMQGASDKISQAAGQQTAASLTAGARANTFSGKRNAARETEAQQKQAQNTEELVKQMKTLNKNLTNNKKKK